MLMLNEAVPGLLQMVWFCGWVVMEVLLIVSVATLLVIVEHELFGFIKQR